MRLLLAGPASASAATFQTQSQLGSARRQGVGRQSDGYLMTQT